MKRVVLITILVVLIGCNQDQSGDKSPSILVGNWITDACEKYGTTNQNPANEWAKGAYEFRSNGELILSMRLFADSSCTGTFDLITPTNLIPENTITYSDLGSVLLKEGIDGGRLNINYPQQAPSSAKTFAGYYTLNGGALCFSDNLNFAPTSISSSDNETTDIDFQKCLTKLN